MTWQTSLFKCFIQAGAQNLLMTLWPISDEVTVKIMSDFYEAAHNSGNAPEALAEVQREWLLKLRTEKGLIINSLSADTRYIQKSKFWFGYNRLLVVLCDPGAERAE